MLTDILFKVRFLWLEDSNAFLNDEMKARGEKHDDHKRTNAYTYAEQVERPHMVSARLTMKLAGNAINHDELILDESE